ncbi:cytochrome b562 [Acinetobacter sp. MB5]|uniref:cytochrome b562 n=1 Tax=Acinetobacter sp. MB5 TaxID=2069438 RepID=UPI000DD0D0CC|nr:cytochrome b562 [Acinetobacter sp. MB5]
MSRIWQMMGAATLVFAVQSSFAADLGQDMEILQKNYMVFQHTQNTNQALTALTAMQQAAQDAKQSIPMKLIGQPDNSPEIQQYHKAFDNLDSELKQTIAMVKTGHLQQAREQAIPVIDQIKKTNHQKFRD